MRAKPFGTADAAIILAHVRRGILRAAALHQMLLARVARGRDLVILPLRMPRKSAHRRQWTRPEALTNRPARHCPGAASARHRPPGTATG